MLAAWHADNRKGCPYNTLSTATLVGGHSPPEFTPKHKKKRGFALQLTDVNTVKNICEKHGFSLSKNFGQNFIVNAGICPKIVRESDINEEFGVLEIGPGIGVLTKEIAAKAAKVVAVEVDERLPLLLSETLSECDNVKIILGDILKINIAEIIENEFKGLKVAVCANLPYYITSPIIMKLLEEKLPIEHITVMVQKEVAQRISANTGTRNAGAITYAVRYYSEPQLLFDVQPGSFYPPPKVTSSVIKLTLLKTPPVSVQDDLHMQQVVRAAFGQRRKTALNAISSGLALPKANVAEAMARASLPPAVRGEQLTLKDFASLSNAILGV